MFAYAKKKDKGGKKWMQKAVKKPGALRKEMGVPEGKSIPVSEIKSKLSLLRKKKDKSEKDTKTMRRLNLALTFKKMHKKKKAEMIDLMIKTANILDDAGLHDEAATLDVMLKYLTADMEDTMFKLTPVGLSAQVAEKIGPLGGPEGAALGEVGKAVMEGHDAIKDEAKKVFKVKRLYVKAEIGDPTDTNYAAGGSPSAADDDQDVGQEDSERFRPGKLWDNPPKIMAADELPVDGKNDPQSGGAQPQQQQQNTQPQRVCPKCQKPFAPKDANQKECDSCSGQPQQNPNQTPGATAVPAAGGGPK
jgi:hypothetical protein